MFKGTIELIYCLKEKNFSVITCKKMKTQNKDS